jgi:Protein of unknown function (DUF1761)
MQNGKINLVAVGLAGIVFWFLQAAWYTLLKGPWLEGVGQTMADLQNRGASPFIIALACDVVVAYVLAWVVARTGEQTAARGVVCGILLWFGLIDTTLATNYAFETRSLQFYFINTGCPLIGLMLVGAVVGLWKRKES